MQFFLQTFRSSVQNTNLFLVKFSLTMYLVRHTYVRKKFKINLYIAVENQILIVYKETSFNELYKSCVLRKG